MSIPKSLRIWLSTRMSGEVLSKNVKLTYRQQVEIKNMIGLKMTQKDIDDFPIILRNYVPYHGIIYRGVFLNDKAVIELVKNGIVTTTRYYSFTKNYNIAKKFGNQIVLKIINPTRNFDISGHSREEEIILDLNTTIKLITEEKLPDGVTQLICTNFL